MRGSFPGFKNLGTVITAITCIASAAAAQTRINIPDNKYSLKDDVQIGRQAAAEIERQLPLIPERTYSENYLESIGRRWLRAVPSRYRHRGFVYRFDVVNVRDVNAFALPGRTLYVNPGLIEAAGREGQLAA